MSALGKKQAHDDLPVAVVSVLRELDARWRAGDVPRAERHILLRDVRADLLAAHHATGSNDAADLLGVDVATFAANVLQERGQQPSRGRYALILTLAVLGAGIAVFGVWPLLVQAIGAINQPPPGPMPITDGVYVDADGNVTYPADPLTTGQFVTIIGGYVFGGLVAAGLMVAGVHLALRNRARAGATVWRTALLIPISVALSLPTAIYYAGQTNYSSAPEVVLLECSLVLGGAILAVVIARWWALRGQAKAAAAR